MAFFGKYYFASYRHGAGEAGQVVEELMRGGHEAGELWLPPTDIYETDDGVVVRMELAGVDPRQVQVHVSDTALTIRGRRQEVCPRCKKCYRQMEIHYGPFERQLHLPGPLALDRGKASYSQGILEIYLPRTKSPTLQECVLPVEACEA